LPGSLELSCKESPGADSIENRAMEERHMERHLLLTVSEQKSSLQGARFLAGFFSKKDVVKLTLFYTMPRPADFWDEEDPRGRTEQREEAIRKEAAKANKALEEARKEVVKLGFAEDKVLVRLRMRQFGKARDILEEGEKGLYDAIVLGNRGLNWFEEAFDGSVSRELMESRRNCPIWICRRTDTGRRGVLLCMDGSAASYRAAEHTALILGNDQPHPVKIFVVKSRALEEQPDVIVAKGKELLAGNRVPNVRISASVVEAYSASKAIIREAEKGRYAAVAAARADKEKGFMDKLFMGSVTMALFREMEHSALWIS
jgi:nucleotide-binding universal stress UspA family protein